MPFLLLILLLPVLGITVRWLFLLLLVLGITCLLEPHGRRLEIGLET